MSRKTSSFPYRQALTKDVQGSGILNAGHYNDGHFSQDLYNRVRLALCRAQGTSSVSALAFRGQFIVLSRFFKGTFRTRSTGLIGSLLGSIERFSS
jgi:hypothetical protein